MFNLISGMNHFPTQNFIPNFLPNFSLKKLKWKTSVKYGSFLFYHFVRKNFGEIVFFLFYFTLLRNKTGLLLVTAAKLSWREELTDVSKHAQIKI